MAVPRYQQNLVTMTGRGPKVAADITGIGEGLAVASKALAYHNERLRRADEQMLQVGMDNQFSNMRTKAMDLRGRNTKGMTDNLIENKDKMYEQSVAKIDDPLTRQNMEVYFEKSFGDQVTWSRNYELKESDAYLKEVDVAYRGNETRKLNSIPAGDYASIDAAIERSTGAARSREGETRWSPETETNYRQATTDEYYVGQVTRWFQEDADQGYKVWEASKDRLKEKLTPGAYNQLANLADSQYGTAKTLEIFKKAKNIFGEDSFSAAEALSDPTSTEFLQVIGVEEKDYKYAGSAATMFRGLHQMNKSREKAKNDNMADEFSKQVSITTAEIAQMEDPAARNASTTNLINKIKQAYWIPLEDRNRAIEGVLTANYTDDPAVLNEIYDRIDNNEITRNYQVRAYQGNGLGRDSSKPEGYLQKKLQLQQEGHYNYRRRAESDYRLWAKANDVDPATTGVFMAHFEARRKALGYTINDPRLVTEVFRDTIRDRHFLPGGKEVAKLPPIWNYRRYLSDTLYAFELTPEQVAKYGESNVAAFLMGQGPVAAGAPRYPAMQAEKPQQPAVQTSGQVEFKPEEVAKPETVPGNTPEAKTAEPETPQGEVSAFGGAQADAEMVRNKMEAEAMRWANLVANPWKLPGDTVDKKLEHANALFYDLVGRNLNADELASTRQEISRGFTD